MREAGNSCFASLAAPPVPGQSNGGRSGYPFKKRSNFLNAIQKTFYISVKKLNQIIQSLLFEPTTKIKKLACLSLILRLSLIWLERRLDLFTYLFFLRKGMSSGPSDKVR